jgi:DNA-binding response OmpR family regulator
VLVVEDDAAIAEVLRLSLEDVGFRVAQAADGNRALAAVERERPNLVVLDLMLPGMDGATFAEELRRRGLRPGLPILVVSAASQARECAAQFGAEGFLPKPFDIDCLLDQARRLTADRAALAR